MAYFTPDYKASGDFIILRHGIAGTDEIVHEALEIDTDNHSSVYYVGGKQLGSVATRNITPELQTLSGEERYKAVKKYYQNLGNTAIAAILNAYPEIKGRTHYKFGDTLVTTESSL